MGALSSRAFFVAGGRGESQRFKAQEGLDLLVAGCEAVGVGRTCAGTGEGSARAGKGLWLTTSKETGTSVFQPQESELGQQPE